MFLYLILFLLLINEIKPCPLTDNYLSRCHCGILTNGESYIKCDENSLNQIPIFKRSFPYDELILSNNNIAMLPQSSFDSIKTIRRINLENNFLTFIDNNLLRLSGNYLEELILTGNNHLNSLEFLTRYPLKNLRILKLNHFNLSEINLAKIFINMTKLEMLSLRSCQLKQIPNLLNIPILDLENNQLTNSISLSTTYTQLNLARNSISSIIFESNENLKNLNLSFNHLLSIDLTDLPKNLISLILNNNLIKQIRFSNSSSSSLLNLDLSSNQLKTLEKNSLIEKLNYFNLQQNPLDCNCHLEWLTKIKFNTSTWICANPKCSVSWVITFNISYIKNGLLIQWRIHNEENIIDYLQIRVSEPFFLSPKLSSNQTEIFLTNNIQSNKKYYLCLIISHRSTRDKYCREFLTEEKEYQSNMNLYLMLIGSCIGGLITFIFIFTCCYLCFQIQKFNRRKSKTIYHQHVPYYSAKKNLQYPIYHSHSTACPYHHENLSNSTNSSQIDSSLSTTTTNLKHIYQTIDSQDYSSLKRQTELFHLWNESLKRQNR